MCAPRLASASVDREQLGADPGLTSKWVPSLLAGMKAAEGLGQNEVSQGGRLQESEAKLGASLGDPVGHLAPSLLGERAGQQPRW